MEYIDILDQAGRPTGEKEDKKSAHERGWWHRTVHIWIMNGKNELLIQKRSPQKDSHPNLWDISAAGHVTAGEDAVAAAIREVKEELGLEVDKSELQYLFSVKSHSTEYDGAYVNNEIQEVFLLRRDPVLEELRLQADEVAEVKFIDYYELKDMMAGGNISSVPHQEEYGKLFAYIDQAINDPV